MDAKGRMRALAALLMLGCTAAACAEVRLPKLISDHAVLQRRAPIHIWGWADPGEQVNVSFHAQRLAATTDGLGQWSLWLLPEEAGGPYTLSVAGSNTLTVSDLLVGDVWFASGQSNMEFPLAGFADSKSFLKNGAEEIANATQPGIRLVRFDRTSSEYPLEDQGATWTLCTPDTAAKFSAVAYFFGREIHEREHVPIGLIYSTWGGTPVAAWISPQALAADASLLPAYAAWAQQSAREAGAAAILARNKREDAAAIAAGKPAPAHPWHPNPLSWEPGGLYNGLVAPAVNYSIKGVLWYQGESDSMRGRAPLYERAFTDLITDWRAHWREGDFPFLFVQISSFTSTPMEEWGMLREAQRRTLKLANTAMAVTLDVGNPANVHPPDKQTVGARLALAARAMVYGEKVEFSGPAYRQATVDGAGMRVWFDHAQGLSARGGELQGFELAGVDRHFHPASARVDRGSVLVAAAEVKEPKWVRYAWANAPLANLYNSAGLPASTFTSEDSPVSECLPSFPGACEP